MFKLLELFFNDQKNESLCFYSTADALEQTGILTQVCIYYETTEIQLLIAKDSFQEFDRFIKKLLLATHKNLLLHKSIVKNIGYYKNQYNKNNNRKNLCYIPTDQEYSDWVGDVYCLFDFHDIASWLYNDKDNNIIFELTPTYPWYNRDPDDDEIFITYQTWMRSYKPYLKKVIPHDVAQQWLQQLQELYALIKKISKTLPCGGMVNCGGCIRINRND